jgi:peptide/nickel transport system substrate-binding protein
MAGRAAHIAGVVARGDKLIVRLTAPSGDLLARMAEPAWCAVPPDTPVDPAGVRVIPSAGPYRVASYTPKQGIVLKRNPNYHGPRPQRLARIEVTVGLPPQRAIPAIEAGRADYALETPPDPAQAAALSARYGRGRHRRYFVTPTPQVDFFALNSHRPVFADPRLRRAVNYAIDRRALAALGDGFVPLLPEQPTDDYLPPGLPGHTGVRVYPDTPDVAKARRLVAGHAGTTVVLYTCDATPCPQQAEIVKHDLGRIGLHVIVKALTQDALNAELARPGAPFDMAWVGWIPDYLDPDAMLNVLIAGDTVVPGLDDAGARARLQAAARLTGARRYVTYARLDAALVRRAAPLAAFGNLSDHDFFSARMGCEVHTVYGMDLAALCVNRG